MNKLFLTSVLSLCCTSVLAAGSLKQSFLNPPDSIRVGCYYYWINERVDPKGVKADLQWMKDNGITMAFLATDIRNRLTYENPWAGQTFGKNKFQSKLWWKNLRTALKTAGQLGIEMGIFNCPGWSQSGGPWVKPDQAMRYLTSSTVVLEGQQSVEIDLTPKQVKSEGKPFQHVKTIAYPVPKGWGEAPKVEIKIAEGGAKNIGELAAGKRNVLLLNLVEKTTLRSLTLQPVEKPMLCKASLDAEVDGEWKRVADFNIDRSNPALNVGFEPYAPVTVSFAAVECSRMRLTLEPTSKAGGFSNVALSAQPRIASYAEKSLAKMGQTPLP